MGSHNDARDQAYARIEQHGLLEMKRNLRLLINVPLFLGGQEGIQGVCILDTHRILNHELLTQVKGAHGRDMGQFEQEVPLTEFRE